MLKPANLQTWLGRVLKFGKLLLCLCFTVEVFSMVINNDRIPVSKLIPDLGAESVCNHRWKKALTAFYGILPLGRTNAVNRFNVSGITYLHKMIHKFECEDPKILFLTFNYRLSPAEIMLIFSGESLK